MEHANMRHGAAGQAVKVLIVDDHPAVREALRQAFRGQMGVQVCGEAPAVQEAMYLVETQRPDVAVVDLALEDAHGLEIVEQLRLEHPHVRALVFSMYDEHIYAERALRAGASGYLMKTEPTRVVVDAVRKIAAGEVYLSQTMATRLMNQMAGGRKARPAFEVDALTDREMTVFQMLGEGYSLEDITERLRLSRKTVETYRRRAKEKLGYNTISQLLQHAVQWKLGSSVAS